MKKLCLIIAVFSLICEVNAQQIKIFPDNFVTDKDMFSEVDNLDGKLLADRTVCRKTGVGEPTITIYRAIGADPMAAKSIVVCPGGAYNILSFDSEGSEVCEYLADNGYNAILLKYRVPRREGREKYEAPLEDAQRAISYIRATGNMLGVNGESIGVMGFSAGAHLSVMCSTSDRIYTPIDKIDQNSCKPDFTILIYPAYLDGENFTLSSEVKVTKDLSPTFIMQSLDDVRYVNSSIFYLYALREAGVPATMHIYSDGGHGYGMRKTGKSSDGWESRLVEWLDKMNK